jgi:amino acid adenylation domain-containing protein
MIYLLSHILDQSAERYPDHAAMRFSSQELTYTQWAGETNRLARLLVDQGVRRGDRVGIFLNKGLHSAVAIYGIMKAGAAYVPLDPSAPAARLAFVIQDCGIKVLVTQPNKLDVIRQLHEKRVGIECVIGLSENPGLTLRTFGWEEVNNTVELAAPDVTLMEDDLAYIMYTSGSTGTPKGIMHSHASGLSYARLSADLYGVQHTDRLSNHSPLHFDMSTFDYFSGPLCGATTVIIPEAYTKLPASLSKLIQDERLTIWYSVPFALIQLLLRGALESRDLSSLRWILFGGEPFPPKHLRALMQQLPHARFSNVYGPAEVNQCTYYHLNPISEGSNEPIPIGVVWNNAEGLVLDNHDNVVLPGDVGELVVRTPTMMKGYWGRPDLNQKAFYRRPVFDQYEDVFYRTGDLVQRQEDGNYRFLGRKDRQIKTRGHRVELDEVENLLSTHSQIEEAAVYAVPDDEGSLRLEGAVLLRNNSECTEADLKKHLTGLLPAYAVPAKILVVTEFPRTTSGKIDRRALQERAISFG